MYQISLEKYVGIKPDENMKIVHGCLVFATIHNIDRVLLLLFENISK